MPRIISANLQQLLDAPACETQTTLEIRPVQTGANIRRVTTCAGGLMINGNFYADDLRKTGEIVQSAFQNVDRANSTIQSVDKIFSLAALSGEFTRARAVVGRYFRSLDGAVTEFVELFSGEVKPSQITATETQIEILDDLVAAGYCVADWSYADDCPYVFRDDNCRYNGTRILSCNKRRRSDAGCEGAGMIYSFGGFETFEEANSTQPGDGNGIDNIIIGGNCFTGETLVVFANGRGLDFATLYDNREHFIGSQVLAFDERNQVAPKKILAIFKATVARMLAVRFSDDSILRAVGTHRFWTEQGEFRSLCDLEPGDGVFVWQNGEWRIERVYGKTEINQETEVYNLTVAEFHSYFVKERQSFAAFAVSNSKQIFNQY